MSRPNVRRTFGFAEPYSFSLPMTLGDVVALGEVLSEGNILTPPAKEFYAHDQRSDSNMIPKVLQLDENSVFANACYMAGLSRAPNVSLITLSRPSIDAPLEMYGFCERYHHGTSYDITASSTKRTGLRFVFCKELMQMVLFALNPNAGANGADLDLLRPATIRGADKFRANLCNVVDQAVTAWTRLLQNPDDVHDEVAAFYVCLEVLIPRRLDKMLAKCKHGETWDCQAVANAFAVPRIIAEHLFRPAMIADTQGGLACSYYDYRKRLAPTQRVRDQVLTYRDVMNANRA